MAGLSKLDARLGYGAVITMLFLWICEMKFLIYFLATVMGWNNSISEQFHRAETQFYYY